MDVRFCEGRNDRREARMRAAGSAEFNSARSSVARVRRICFSLTKTYMDVRTRCRDCAHVCGLRPIIHFFLHSTDRSILYALPGSHQMYASFWSQRKTARSIGQITARELG